MTTNENRRLTNKIALITGAGSGFGRATSFRFAREGAKVIVVDRDLPSAEATVASIKKDIGTDALAIKCDISNRAEVTIMGKEVFEKFPRLDVLINNAGVAMLSVGDLCTLSEKGWDEAMGVNLRGTWLVTREFARRMKKQDIAGELRGKIVIVSSVAGKVPYTPLGAYSISKAGLIAMTQVFAQELAPFKITVNAICPGFHSPESILMMKRLPGRVSNGLAARSRWSGSARRRTSPTLCSSWPPRNPIISRGNPL